MSAFLSINQKSVLCHFHVQAFDYRPIHNVDFVPAFPTMKKQKPQTARILQGNINLGPKQHQRST